ncbi:glycosyltransferase family 4 protein [Amantichitinum ursilacus]|uniref:D-inositol-3-phosphate glycosyltransferase n=1 Tax=Amantichitinum ursilacus TaxID=857265 RepID=A0A0N1JSJ0_9NEIS|nr:glycosyltransferase family 4 protein [Amantichitinum ursilacus]KPC51824.1 D-inositol-3-phosphate glycosyltransferase [Amantichitinum ursilacus]
MATILTGKSYPFIFNTPRSNQFDTVVRSKVYSGHRFWGPLQAVSVQKRVGGPDLIHAFNSIPLDLKPYVLGFEGELPRSMSGPGRVAVRKLLRPQLLSRRCRGLFPISKFARHLFERSARDWPDFDQALAKCQVMYPSIPLHVTAARTLHTNPITLTFIGAEWARKGGAVCARVARLLKAAGVPFVLNVISRMDYGIHVYTDTSAEFYANDIAALKTEGVRLLNGLPNKQVLEILAQSDLCLLPTLDDSFGFNIIESMSYGVPVIASGICAIPEIIDDGVDGFLLKLPVDEGGRWQHIYTPGEQRAGADFQRKLDATYNDMAAQISAIVQRVVDGQIDYHALSANAIKKIETRFEANLISEQWHQIYKRSLRAA